MLPEAVSAELRLLDFIGTDFQLKALPCGAINSSYELQAGNHRYFLKCFAKNTPTRLDRRALFAMQKQLATAGLAAEPVYFSETGEFVLEAWQDFKTLEDIDVSTDEKVLILAGRMARIHQQPVHCPELDLISDWSRYLKLARISCGALYNNVAKYERHWRALSKNTFCHHDLAFAHICIEPQGMVLDWEYQARSVAEFDLACAVLVNQLDDRYARALVERYASAMEQDSLALWLQTQTMLPLAELTSELWYLAAEAGREQTGD
ncbi:phosphotransferase [Lacimicrobium alkaliphilum]|uniref:Aminoglycoside phosphotransferase domain-containing protein n=1 Tax=Lacimicrobium alkaliphilum TaxID=1526571 RepID=A0ABQ1R2J6_9ALTE|nr:phosphotransferase [Lacimicrobium alkaliphilum]GGD55917.1 hypothetical protein GCM10011357_09400 [Lacimicrobium alkaliphilum]